MKSSEIKYNRIGQSYNSTRKADPYLLERLIAMLDPQPEEAFLDLGCGTGRLLKRASRELRSESDRGRPLFQMLHHAGSAPVEIDFREGRAEQIPVRMAEVRLVFMSMMFHHIEDLDAAIAEFGRVLQGGGFVCVRNSTLDSLDSYPYLEHFPGARSA